MSTAIQNLQSTFSTKNIYNFADFKGQFRVEGSQNPLKGVKGAFQGISERFRGFKNFEIFIESLVDNYFGNSLGHLLGNFSDNYFFYFFHNSFGILFGNSFDKFFKNPFDHSYDNFSD